MTAADSDVGAVSWSRVAIIGMRDGQAWVLARDGNVAIVQLEGRAFLGVHMQGDRSWSCAGSWPTRSAGCGARTNCDGEVVAELDVVEQMTEMLRC